MDSVKHKTSKRKQRTGLANSGEKNGDSQNKSDSTNLFEINPEITATQTELLTQPMTRTINKQTTANQKLLR